MPILVGQAKKRMKHAIILYSIMFLIIVSSVHALTTASAEPYLMHYYPMNSTTDYTPNGNSVTLTNKGAVLANDLWGTANSAYDFEFDDKDNMSTTSDIVLNNIDGYSFIVGVWVIGETVSADWMPVIGCSYNELHEGILIANYGASDFLLIGTYDTGNAVNQHRETEIADGNPLHITMIYNGSYLWACLNDTGCDDSIELGGQYKTVRACDAGVWLGTEQNRQEFFDGVIDELVIYNYTVKDTTEADEWADWLYNSGNKQTILVDHSGAGETIPPNYSSIVTNGTNKTATTILFNTTWYDATALDGWMFEHNQSGSFANSSFNRTWSHNNVSMYDLVLTLTRGQHLGWRFCANDTYDNMNCTDRQVLEVLNSPPLVVTSFNVSNGRKINSNESIGWTAVSDPDSDPVTYNVWFNDSGGWYIYNTTSNLNFTTNVSIEKLYYYWVETYDGYEAGGNSTVMNITLDVTAPIITWHAPAYDSVYTNYSTYIVNITCTDTNEVWSINITSILVANSSQRESVYSYNYSAASVNNYTTIGLHPSGQHYIGVYCYDAHTYGEDILDYDYANGDITFYDYRDYSDNYKVEFGYYYNGEVHKVTAQQISNYNINPFLMKVRNDYEFGALFDLPDADFKFGFRFPEGDNIYLIHEENAHFIIRNKYYIDFDAFVCEWDGGLKDCIFANPNVVNLNGYYYIFYSLIDPFGVPYSDDLRDYFDVGARLVFYTKSTGALNLESDNQILYYDMIPSYLNFHNNATDSTYINSHVNISAILNDTFALAGWQIMGHNASGAWQRFNVTQEEGENVQIQHFNFTLIPTLPHSYVCVNISVYDWYSSAIIYAPYPYLNNESNLSCFYVRNSYPTVPAILSPTNESTTYNNATMFDWSDSTDADSDPLYYSLVISNQSDMAYVWYNNTNVSSSTYTLTSDESLPDGTWYWQINVTDAYDTQNYTNIYQYVINTSFGISSQAKNCTTCYNNYDIQFNMTLANSGADTVYFHSNFSGAWLNYSDGVSNISLVYYYSVLSNNLSNQEMIGWQWVANNTAGAKITSTMQTFNISNRIPTHNSPLINSSSLGNTTSEDLGCYPYNQSDQDGDTLSTFYDWYKEGTAQLINNAVLGSGNTSKGDKWICQVITFDGYDNSTALNTSTLQIVDDEAPYYTGLNNNITANATVPTMVNWSVYIMDNHNLSSYIFSYNDTGVWSADSPVFITSNATNISVVKTIYSENSYICGNFTFNDTSNNRNTTTVSCFTTAIATTSTLTHLTFTTNETLYYNLNLTQLYLNYSIFTLTAYHSDNNTYKQYPSMYNISSAWTNAANLMDNDWTTAGYAENGKIANLSINYTVYSRDYNLKWEVRGLYNWTNLTLDSCDRSTGILQFEVRSLWNVAGYDGLLYYCRDSSNDWTLLFNDTSPAGDPSFYNEQLNGNLRSYPSQINISINDIIHYYNESEWNNSNTPATVVLNNTLINYIFNDNCSCTNCINSKEYCSFNISVYSNSRGLLEFTSQYNEIIGTINNCSGDDYISYNYTTLNISFYDHLDAVKTVDYEATSIYRQGNFTANFSMDSIGITEMIYCIYPHWAYFYVDQHNRYYDPVSEVYYNYFLDDFLADNSTAFLSLYTQNNTDQVLFTVLDLNGNRVAEAYIHVLKYDVGSGTYDLTEILQTDTQGQTIANIELYDTYYNFLIYYNGELVYTEQAVRIITTTRTFTISLEGTGWMENFETALGIDYDLYFNEGTNNFVYTYADTASEIHEGCLRVEVLNDTGLFTLSDSCSQATSGTLVYTITPLNGSTYTATGYVKFDDEIILAVEQRIYAAVRDFLYRNNPQLALFINGILLITLFAIGLPFPAISLTLMALHLIIASLLKLWNVAFAVVGGIIVLIVIQLWLLERRS